MTASTDTEHTAETPDAAADDLTPDRTPSNIADDATEDANSTAADDPDTGDDDTPDDLRAARREAANRRKELRTAEAALATATDTIGNLQRQLTEQIITNSDALPWMHRPADLFEIGGVDVADLTDDAGNIDPAQLATALTELQGERPYLFGLRPVSGYDLFTSMGRQNSTPAAPSTDPGAAWQKALKHPS